MRNFFILWKREIAAYFYSPIAYVMSMFFLFVMGYSFWVLVNVLAQGAFGTTVMGELFGSIFFWLALLVVAPVLTMRLFAEEKRMGTIEALMTAPVTEASVVLAKYAGTLTLFILMWLPTAAYAFMLKLFDPFATIDYGPMLSGYLGTLLIGAFYLSVGLFASSLTRNQIVAAIISFAIICVAFLAGFLPYITPQPVVRDVAEYFSSPMHMLDFSRGMVDTRPLVLYTTGVIFMLFLTIRITVSKRWR
jgi:ABC-2 type transport system permease protein